MEFWRMKLDSIPCSEEEMEKAADGAFTFGNYNRNRINEKGIAGITGMYLTVTLYTQEIQ